MAFSIKYGNLLDCSVDAILNSLGTDGRIYGRLCRNIILNSSDKEIKNFIDSKTNSKIGDIYLTSAGKLPAKNIIHIVTPFKHLDDKKNTALKKAYLDVLNFAIEKGFKNIAIPFIGTGANGYSDKDAYNAAVDACADISELEEQQDKDILDITIVTYLKEKNVYINREWQNKTKKEARRVGYDKENLYNRQRALDEEIFDSYEDDEEIFYDRCCSIDGFIEDEDINNVKFCDISSYKGNIVNQIIYRIKNIDMQKLMNVDLQYYKHPYDFVTDFLNKKNIDDRQLLRNGMDRRRKGQLAKQKSIKKMDIYRISFVFNMNFEETYEFMTIAGVTFTPLSELDIFYFGYLTGVFENMIKKYSKINKLLDLDQLASDLGFNFSKEIDDQFAW